MQYIKDSKVYSKRNIKIPNTSLGKNVSNEFLKGFGYLPLEIIYPELGVDEMYDNFIDEVLEDKVVRTYQVKSKPPKPLEVVKEEKIREINSRCKTEIISGFISNALVKNGKYSSEEIDQLNLIGAVTTKTAMPYKVNDVYRVHTPEQLQQVLKDGARIKNRLLTKANSLKYYINIAQSLEELEAINW